MRLGRTPIQEWSAVFKDKATHVVSRGLICIHSDRDKRHKGVETGFQLGQIAGQEGGPRSTFLTCDLHKLEFAVRS